MSQVLTVAIDADVVRVATELRTGTYVWHQPQTLFYFRRNGRTIEQIAGVIKDAFAPTSHAEAVRVPLPPSIAPEKYGLL